MKKAPIILFIISLFFVLSLFITPLIVKNGTIDSCRACTAAECCEINYMAANLTNAYNTVLGDEQSNDR